MSAQPAARVPSPPAEPSAARSVWLVTQRELGSKLRSKAFVISTLILLGLALVGVVWGAIAASNVQGMPVAVTAETASVVEGMTGIDAKPADSVDAALAMVEDGSVDAAVVPDDEPVGPYPYKIVAKDSYPETLVAMLSVSPRVELLDSSPQDSILRYLVAVGFGVVFLMAASMFGGTIAQSVVEEKQTRVVELLIAAIPVRVLLAGKVIGNTILAMAQIIALAVIAVAGLVVAGQTTAVEGLGGPLVWFSVFFLFGFVLLAALFAAAGAMVSRQEDIGSTTTPLTMLILAPYLLVIFFNDNPLVLAVMSYVPFSAPVAMPLRIYLGQVAWWEPVLSLVILIATCLAAILVGSRVYENSLLRMGARVKLREALAG
ncbi:ABC transporter permease [Microbacterium sp. NPDC019599]|uniref:ABC transporter permease n=1 Tax=Microbacterium sp. NPDC019599 TaxID=3154690 RepID=UPI0033E963E8